MQTVKEISELRAIISGWKKAGARVAMVPTMGALHEGHLTLVRAAAAKADKVLASIFVNPLQFNDRADFDRYQRSEDKDAALLAGAGCDLLWLPDEAILYPGGFATTIHVGGITERWEGEARPGHFDGVATVVAKLFTAAQPSDAFFGEKDFQQLALIRRMVTDLTLPVEIHGVETVRDHDGLALSSRNARLSEEDRLRAAELPRAMQAVAEAIAAGLPVTPALNTARTALREAGFDSIDYLALVDAATLEPLSEKSEQPMRLIAAATIGGTRLIDNMSVKMDTVSGD